MVDIKKPPYFSTFDEAQKYYRILARPGRPIQAREWNDLQEQLQKQIERVGAHLFENGSQVLPGTNDGVTYRNDIGFIKLSAVSTGQVASTQAAITNLWLGKTIISTSGSLGIKAKVIGYKVADTLDEVRLFVEYIKADETLGTSTVFTPGQNIETEETVPSSGTISSDTTAVGKVSAVFIKNSVYFFNGDFILVDEQSVFIEPLDPENQSAWGNKPTAKVGLNVVRSIVTFEEDEELGDNANPSDSFGAPGADRLCITATLEQRDYNEQSDGKFIELLRVSKGIVQQRVRKTEYSVLEDTMARRTYDESGDYTVKDFLIDVKPYLLEDDNSGVHSIDEFYFDTQLEAEAAGLALFNEEEACGAVDSSGAPVSNKWLPARTPERFLELAKTKLTLQIDPGKAYVKGYEIEKLAPSYVDVDKARSLRFQNNRTINPELGSFVYVTNVFGAPEISSYELVEIHNVLKTSNNDISRASTSLIGTARILAIEYFSGIHGDPSGSPSPSVPAVYKLYLFDVKAAPGKNILQMKKIVSIDGYSFSADLSLQYYALEGSVTTDNHSSTTLSGNGTSFVNKTSQKVVEGDYLRIRQADGSFALRQIAATPTSDTSVTLETAVTVNGNQPLDIAYATFNGLEAAPGLVFPLPERFAYTIRGADADDVPNSVIDTVFSVRREFIQNAVNGVITIQLDNASTEEFLPYSANDYVVINTTNSDWLRLAAGSSYTAGQGIDGFVQITGSNKQAKIFTSSPTDNNSYYIIATVYKGGGNSSKEKSKTAIRGKFVSGSYNGPYEVTASEKTDLNVISLNKCDILKVTRIVMSPDFSVLPSSLETLPADHKDITDRYELDNGQRDYYYDIGSVYLKPGAERPTGRVRVEFDWFEHGSGAFFSVDSYPFRSENSSSVTMDYSEIPQFTDSTGRVYDLRDCIDFRPTKTASDDFSVVDMPRSAIRVDFHHYLHRSDNLYLDRFGNFRIAKGTPDINPTAPNTPADGMSLADLDIQAYTASAKECFVRKKDNRRYTMRDIGKIEQRVSNLEYYTLLSLLEKEAKDLQVKDSQGLDRFKNGFIVDNFNSLLLSDVGNIDYKAAIDTSAEELRPSICQKSVDLIETNSLITQPVTRKDKRSQNNYALTGKLYTIKYSPVKFLEQELASQVENVNPYKKFTWTGRVSLNPSTDTWRDTVTLPKITVVDDTAFKAAEAGVNPNQIIWGEWETFHHTDVSKKKLKTIIEYGENKPNGFHDHYWPIYVTKRQKTTTTKTTTNIRKGFSEKVVPTGYKTQSLGSRIVYITPADFIRARSITIEGHGFLPKARLYPFFDDQSVAQYCQPEEIRADAQGSVNFKFNLPKGKFLTGERIFKLTTSPTNQLLPVPASEGAAKYYAVGWIDHSQETELSIRQFEVQTIAHEDKKVKVDVDVDILEKTTRHDPIAQSFAVLEKGGCFILAVDVFFYSKDQNIPITLQLRPLSNDGYPTNRIMPFGEVIKPAADVVVNSVNLTTGTMTVSANGSIQGYTAGPWDGTVTNADDTVNEDLQKVTNASGTTISNGVPFEFNAAGAHKDMIPTRFIFSSPIFLQENNDYAIVLISDSADYQAWVSQAGPITKRPGGVPLFGKDVNTIIGTDTAILEDNYINGVFFRSSNGVTWNADQVVDLKFTLHKAKFLTNETATMEFVNQTLPNSDLINDPLVTKTGSTKVRVLHENHGLPALSSTPARVVLSGIENANGIDETLLTRDIGWPIESVELDSYIIDVGVAATADGRCGGLGVTASENVSMDTMFFNVNQLKFPNTEAFWTCSTTNGGNVSYYNSKAEPFVINPFKELEPNATTNFANIMTVSSTINEYKTGSSIDGEDFDGPSTAVDTLNGVADRKSLRLKAVLRTTNENLSPVLDSDRIAAICVANRINNVAGSGGYNINVTGLDDLLVIPTSANAAGKIKFYVDTTGINKGKLETTDPTIAEHLSKLDVGKLVTITGAAGANRNKTALITEVSYTAAEKCSIVLDTTFGGSTGTDTGTVVFTQKDNFVDEIAPGGGSAAFKYVTTQLTLARPSTALRISFDANRHESNDIEVYYRTLRQDSTTPFEDLNWVKAQFNVQQNGTLTESYPTANFSDDVFSEYSATINDLPPFIGFAIKIVGKGGNSSKPPRVRNLMGIALDE